MLYIAIFMIHGVIVGRYIVLKGRVPELVVPNLDDTMVRYITVLLSV